MLRARRYARHTSVRRHVTGQRSINTFAIIVADLAHGILLATVITWGKFHTPLRGAGAATAAFLTEIYFLFAQHAIFKTVDPAPSGAARA